MIQSSQYHSPYSVRFIITIIIDIIMERVIIQIIMLLQIPVRLQEPKVVHRNLKVHISRSAGLTGI
jgi:hypothetical protein